MVVNRPIRISEFRHQSVPYWQYQAFNLNKAVSKLVVSRSSKKSETQLIGFSFLRKDFILQKLTTTFLSILLKWVLKGGLLANRPPFSTLSLVSKWCDSNLYFDKKRRCASVKICLILLLFESLPIGDTDLASSFDKSGWLVTFRWL